MGLENPLYERCASPSAGVRTRSTRASPTWRPSSARSAPALERRLAASPLAGHTGTLTLSTYREAVRLAFTDGRLAAAEPWPIARDVVGQEFGLPSSDPRRPMALFPGLTLLELILGYRSLDQLQDAYPDCMVRGGEPRALLHTLFPRTHSDVWPLV